MSQSPRGGRAPSPDQSRQAVAAPRDAIHVVSAHGLFRLLIVLLAVWSFFAGFAMLTGLDALSYDGSQTASRVIGLQLAAAAPIYALIAWRRDEYRLLLWLPYVAQLAIILPGIWQLIVDQHIDAPLLLVVSIIFLALLVYLWLSSHPTDFFAVGDEEDDDSAYYDDEEDEADLQADVSTNPSPSNDRTRRYRKL